MGGGGERRKESPENSRSRGEAVAEQGAQVSGAAGGSWCSPGTPGAQTERRGGLEKGGIVLCALGEGGDCRSQVNAAELREAAGSQSRGRGPAWGHSPGGRRVSPVLSRGLCGFLVNPPTPETPIAQYSDPKH